MGVRTAKITKMTSTIIPRTHKFNQHIEKHKNTKNGGRSALYFLLLGVCFGRQSTGLIDITTKMDIVPKTSLANTMGGTNLVHKRLGGMVAGKAVGIVLCI